VFVFGLLFLGSVFAQENNLNVGLSVPESYGKVYPGGDFVVELNVMNLGAEKRVDVVVEYSVTGEDGAVVLSEHETVAVETKASFVKTLHIPPEAKAGRYIVLARVQIINSDTQASSSASFEVVERPRDILSTATSWFQEHVWWFVSAALAVLLLFLVYRSRRRISALFLKNKVRAIVRQKLGKGH